MIRWSIPSASLALTVLLAACQGVHPAAAPVVPHDAAHETVAPSAGAVSAAAAPVPDQAAQAYADALEAARAGHTAEAVSKFKALSAAYPQYAGPEVNLGLIEVGAGRLADAEAAFKTALERSPDDAVAGNELGIVERRLGKFTEAEAVYERTIAAQPTYAPAYLNLGILYDLYLAEPQKALEQFEKYVQLAGDNKQVTGWLAELRKRVGAPVPSPKKEAS